MSVASRTVSLRDYVNAVDGQIEAGLSFGQVEGFIDACSIDEEHKAALWLWAWLHQSPDVRRTFADAEDLGPAQVGALMRRALAVAEFPSAAEEAIMCRTSS